MTSGILVPVILLLHWVQVKGQQQYFRVKPVDTEVVEGQQVELQCQVANQAGLVQWSKDGFLLGFDPDIPGYPRYSMVVDEARGIYNLRIHNVQLEDEGEYQCQVGPAVEQHPIRTGAKLTVLVPPRDVSIDHRPDVSIVEVREAEKVVLTCHAFRTKPATRLRWFRKNVELLPEASRTTIQKASELLFNTFSAIVLYPKVDDNGATYSCEALHPGLLKPIKASITISVLAPPGLPQIEGYQEGDIVQLGDTLTLTCTSRGGNPPARLVWFRNGVQVDHSYSSNARGSTNTLTFTVGHIDNNAIYRCEAANDVTRVPSTAQVKLKVLYPPKKVTISGPTEARRGETITVMCSSSPANPAVKVSWVIDGVPIQAGEMTTRPVDDGWVTTSTLTLTLTRQDPDLKTFTCYAETPTRHEAIVETTKINVIYPPGQPTILGYREGTALQAGDLQRFSCVSLGGNPPASLHWFKGDREIRTVTSTTGSGVSSELVIRAGASDNGAIYRCQAKSPAIAEALEASIVLMVLFAPDNVTITVDPPHPRAGQMLNFVCSTAPSNPAAIITWRRNGTLILAHHVETFLGPHGSKITRSQILMNASASDDGETFTCEARNPLWPRSVKADIKLLVAYKPEFIPPLTEVDIVEGETWNVELKLRANPRISAFRWTKGGSPVPVLSAELQLMEVAQSKHRVIAEGPKLHLSQVSRQDAGSYICEASNAEGASNATVVLNVLYPASITSITSSVRAAEGYNASLECFVDANPLSQDTVVWKRPNYDMFSTIHHQEASGRSILTIVNVSREDSGEFHCIAFNGLGEEAVRSALLGVDFRPSISYSAVKTKQAAEEGESTELLCSAEGTPNVTFMWMTPSAQVFENTNGSKYYSETRRKGQTHWENVLGIHQVVRDDYGAYNCVAKNELGQDILKVELVKRSVPESPTNFRLGNVTTTGVQLLWTPGFDGGLQQIFRLRYKRVGAMSSRYLDVPGDQSSCWVYGLDTGKEYVFSVSGINDLGESLGSQNVVQVFTKSKSHDENTKKTVQKDKSAHRGFSKTIYIFGSVFGVMITFLAMCILGCICRRRYRRRIAGRRMYELGQVAHVLEENALNKVQEELGPKAFFITPPEKCVHNHREVEQVELQGLPCHPSTTYLPSPFFHQLSHHTQPSSEKRMKKKKKKKYKDDTDYDEVLVAGDSFAM